MAEFKCPTCKFYKCGSRCECCFDCGHYEEDKYRWHDLRKKPDDLPTHSNIVEVELCHTTLGIYHDHTWFKDGNWKHYTNNSYGKVIGWREIEPMEGAKE